MGDVLETRKLGLAAYMKMMGAEIEKVIPATNTFVLRHTSGKSLHEWELEYINTDCYRHDTELVHLRRLLRGR